MYEEGGNNEWLFSTYSEGEVILISSVSVSSSSSSGSGSQDRRGSWVFGTIVELTAPALFQVTMDVQVWAGGTAPIVIEVNRTWSPVGADYFFYALLRDGHFNWSIINAVVIIQVTPARSSRSYY